jgi:oligopeptide transport system ATP-binding protein
MADGAMPAAAGEPLVSVRGLGMHFPVLRGLLRRRVGAIRAVDDVSLDIEEGETLGLVGESGCGKSTTGRLILRLYRPTAGEIRLEGREIARLEGAALRALRPKMQMIFQDPQASLNPRMTAGSIIAEPLDEHARLDRKARRARVFELMDAVGLARSFASRYPHAFSGGERQRIGIARALALNPKLVVCDEPIAALDVSIQAQVVNLLRDLPERFGLTYLFISHDLSMVRHIATRVAVMYLGRIMEIAPAGALYADPLHPYTRALISAVPSPDPAVEANRRHIILAGEVPSPARPPAGCVFSTRCPEAVARCRAEVPAFRGVAPGRQVACHLV